MSTNLGKKTRKTQTKLTICQHSPFARLTLSGDLILSKTGKLNRRPAMMGRRLSRTRKSKFGVGHVFGAESDSIQRVSVNRRLRLCWQGRRRDSRFSNRKQTGQCSRRCDFGSVECPVKAKPTMSRICKNLTQKKKIVELDRGGTNDGSAYSWQTTNWGNCWTICPKKMSKKLATV